MIDSHDDTMLTDIWEENDYGCLKRMQSVRVFVNHRYKTYLRKFCRNQNKYRRRCKKITEPGAVFGEPDKIKQCLFGDGKKKKSVREFVSLLENTKEYKQCSRCFKFSKKKNRCHKECVKSYRLVHMAKKWPKCGDDWFCVICLTIYSKYQDLAIHYLRHNWDEVKSFEIHPIVCREAVS